MKIPKQVKIGGHIFNVSQRECEKDLMGECDPIKNEIWINPKAPKSQQEATFIHEVFHAINTTMSGGQAHSLLDSLSEQFYQVLSDNKLLAK